MVMCYLTLCSSLGFWPVTLHLSWTTYCAPTMCQHRSLHLWAQQWWPLGIHIPFSYLQSFRFRGRTERNWSQLFPGKTVNEHKANYFRLESSMKWSRKGCNLQQKPYIKHILLNPNAMYWLSDQADPWGSELQLPRGPKRAQNYFIAETCIECFLFHATLQWKKADRPDFKVP